MRILIDECLNWRLARMNLAIRSIEGNLALERADKFHRDLHKDLKPDYILKAVWRLWGTR